MRRPPFCPPSMSVLVVQIPPRKRPGPQGSAGADTPTESGSPALPGEWLWVKTENGLTVHSQGHAVPSDMPPSEAAVAVLSELDISWHSITLPRAPSGKLKAAVLGMLEEQLLTDPEQLHVALAPEAQPGERCWVAVVDKTWLGQTLAAFERQGVLIDRVVPALWPDERAHGHFFDAAPPGSTPEPALAMADANGIVCLPLSGSLARALFPAGAAKSGRWTATPAVAAAVERWLGAPVTVRNAGDQLLRAAQSTWNLRQFDLAPRLRGSLALRDAWRRFMRPTWKPVRWGLVALVTVQILALNLWALSHRQAVETRQRAQAALLTEAHPKVRMIRDAPLQMERETDLLRAAAGRPGSGDLETLLAAASSAWPDAQGPMQNLRFQTGQLSLSAAGWSPQDIRQFTERLKPAGWVVASQGGRVVITRGTP
jgi:general secretion pathway protein L